MINEQLTIQRTITINNLHEITKKLIEFSEKGFLTEKQWCEVLEIITQCNDLLEKVVPKIAGDSMNVTF
jgi:hypothetical protein